MDSKLLKSAVSAGVIAAIVMVVLEMVMNPLILGAPMWGPPRMMAAIVLGKEVLPPPGTFDAGIIMAGMLVHFVLSIVYAIVIGLVVRSMSFGMAILLGAVAGLALFFINFYGFSNVFPWFENARNWVQIVIHISFGVAAAWAFKGIQAKSAETAAA